MARLDDSSSCVEQERLHALVAVQKQHITELRVQLREALVSDPFSTPWPWLGVGTHPYCLQQQTSSSKRGPTAACVLHVFAQEAQQQQQLKLVQQSPARRSARTLLEQAAADNTNLAKRVEELRAERNALTVTKAALTAQVCCASCPTWPGADSLLRAGSLPQPPTSHTHTHTIHCCCAGVGTHQGCGQ